jgi:dihydroorotase
MTLLFKQATILDFQSPYHLQQKDVLIENGFITKIDDAITTAVEKVIEEKNLYLSTGFTDIFAHFNDPGFEYKESLETGSKAALKGGYTNVMVIPNTAPVLDKKTSIDYITQKSKTLCVGISPIAAITAHTEGKLLTEMIEMHQAGAVAFGDGIHPVQQSGILLKALQYVKAFDGTIIQVPYDMSLAANGLINEGVLSTQLGLPGSPSLAEELMISRDLELCAYTDSKLHITGISTAKSLALIKAAKAKNIKVTCSVTPYHLLLNENDIINYNTNFKVTPPLRTPEDNMALQQGVLEGSIDCIASHHLPQDLDAKQCEFANAQYGMSTIEHSFNALASIKGITPEKIYTVLSKNSSALFNINKKSIALNHEAAITAFSLTNEATITASSFLSKGKNSGFIGCTLKGQIIATINKEYSYIA